MSGEKIAVVTGGNRGIGFAIVKGLCEKFKGIVYLTARDEVQGLAAVAELTEMGLQPYFHQLDITDTTSILMFADFIKSFYGGFDVLVNNAGIAYKVSATTPFSEQADVTIAVNYFGLLNVCNALFPLLRPYARVVNLSSSCGHLLKIPSKEIRTKFCDPELDVDGLNSIMMEFVQSAANDTNIEDGWGMSAYNVSKVGVSALTMIQQREFDSDSREGIVVNSVHPGYVNTDMSSHRGPLTPEQGADAPVYLALLPNSPNIPKGKYVWCDRKVVSWTS